MKSLGPGPATGGRWVEAVAAPGRPLPAGPRRSGAGSRSVGTTRPTGRVELFVAEPVAPAGPGTWVIAIVLITATTAAVLAGGWIGGAQATLLVAVVGVAEAILLGRSGIGRLAAAGIAIPLCAAVVVPTTVGLMPLSVRGFGLQHAVGEYIVEAIAGLLSTGPNQFVQWAFMVGLSTIVWACGYWLGWLGFRERRGVLAVLPALVVLAVNVLNAPSITIGAGPSSSIGLAEIVALLAALLLIGLVELSSLASHWRSRRVPALQGLRGRFTTALAVTAIGVVATSLLIPPLTSTDIAANLFNGFGHGPGGGPVQGVARVGFSSVVSPGAALLNDPVDVLRYYTDQGQGAYLGAVGDTVFIDGSWIPGFQSGQLPVEVAQTLKNGGAIPRDPSALGGSRATVTANITYTVSAGNATASALASLGLFPGDASSVSHSGTVIGQAVASPAGHAPAAFRTATPTPHLAPSPAPTPRLILPSPAPSFSPGGASTDFLTVDQYYLGSGTITSLTTTGSTSQATVPQLEAAGTAYPGWVLGDAAPLVAVGEGVAAASQAAAVARLAQLWTQGITDPYDQAVAIESHLRSSEFSYTLTPPKTPGGEWPIVYFLDTSHAGYCQYFASAMGAMLRSLKIPTELVTGYGPGTATGHFTAAHQPIYQVTSTDAHAWVQAYFPGYGWVPFEPTPPSSFGVYSTFLRGGQTPVPSLTLPSATARPARPTPPPVGTASTPTAAAGSPRWLLGFPAALALLVVVLLVGLQWWRRPRSLAGVWSRLTLAARLTGVRRDEAETRTAFANRLARALGGGGPPLLRTELGTVAAVSGKAEFSPEGLADPDRRLWRDTWASLAPALTRLVRRRLLHRRAVV